MSDDINKKVKQLVEILGQDGSSDTVKGLLDMLGNSMSKEKNNAQKALVETDSSHEDRVERERGRERDETDEKGDMMRKIKKIMDTLNTKDDPRMGLLTGLKPYLSQKRQKHLSTYVKMLHMSKLAGHFNDFTDKDD